MSQHQARKRWPELPDRRQRRRVHRPAVAPARGDAVVEIGPGLSALTRPLLERLDRLTVVEIDRDLAARLRKQFEADRLTVVEADALTVDFAVRPRTARGRQSAVQHLQPAAVPPHGLGRPIRDQHFMLQREVIDRMVAEPGSSDYSRLSVMLQSRYRMHKLFDVPPEAFDPPPKVVSAVVRMMPLPGDRLRPVSARAFETVVARAFSQRRKMLRRVLADWAPQVPWEALDIAPTARAEDVSVDRYIRLSDALVAAGVLQAG